MDKIYIVLIFDTVEYCNCLIHSYICFSQKQVNSFYSKYYKPLSMGHIDIYTICYEFNESYDFPIEFY